MADEPNVNAAEAAETLFAERLRALREAADLTQGQLAARMTQLGYAMHQTAIAKIELGQRPVRLNEVAAFAAALRVPTSDLLAATENTPEAEAIWSDLHAVTAQRLELTRRRTELDEQRMILQERLAELASQLAVLEDREAAARKKWEAAKAGKAERASGPKEHPQVSIATVKELYANALTCAYPGCERPLCRVNEDGSRTLNSRITHIHARQERGPRWNPDMSSEENRSPDNLLLLCIEHADEIDQSDRISLYPSEVLNDWKREQLARFDEGADGWMITEPEATEAVRKSADLEMSLTAETLSLGGLGGSAPSAGGGGGSAIGRGARGGRGGPGGPININLSGQPGRAPGAGGGGSGHIDPDSPLFWRGEGMPTLGASTFLGIDSNDGGDTTLGPTDGGNPIRAVGGKGAKAGTGIRLKSDKLFVSTLMLANYVEFRGSFGYVTGTGFAFYNAFNLRDPLRFTGLAILECGGVPKGEYALVLEALDPKNSVASAISFAFNVTESGDILRSMFKFALQVNVNLFGMWTIRARHEDKELARLPVIVKQGAPD